MNHIDTTLSIIIGYLDEFKAQQKNACRVASRALQLIHDHPHHTAASLRIQFPIGPSLEYLEGILDNLRDHNMIEDIGTGWLIVPLHARLITDPLMSDLPHEDGLIAAYTEELIERAAYKARIARQILSVAAGLRNIQLYDQIVERASQREHNPTAQVWYALMDANMIHWRTVGDDDDSEVILKLTDPTERKARSK